MRLDSTVEGFSAPNAQVFLYADAVDQGEFFLDSTTADGAGNWSIPNVDLTVSAFLTAVQDSANRTSAFSASFASAVIDHRCTGGPEQPRDLWP